MSDFKLSDKIIKRNSIEETLHVSNVKEFIRLLKEDLKKEFCSGFISLSEECFEREWNKSIKKRAGDLK